MKRVYSRCNSGHYFVGEHCPLDGWSSDASREITDAARRLEEVRIALSIDALRQTGVCEAALARAIVVEFGSVASAFEVLAPEGYGVDGQFRLLRDLDWNFK